MDKKMFVWIGIILVAIFIFTQQNNVQDNQPTDKSIKKEATGSLIIDSPGSGSYSYYSVYPPYMDGTYFQASQTFTITDFALQALRQGSPGIVTIKLYLADGNGYPTGSVLASGSINGNSLSGTAYEWFEVPMSAYTLNSGTYYAVTIETQGSSSSNAIRHTLDPYLGFGGGVRIISSNGGSSWSRDSGQDLIFKIYGTTGGGGSYCGDGTCNVGEDCSNCASDCGACSCPTSFAEFTSYANNWVSCS